MPPRKSQDTTNAVAAPARRTLPKLSKKATWHPESGLTVSSLGQAIPKEILEDARSVKLDEYAKTRYLTDDNIYLAFFPRKPIHRSPLFAVLAISRSRLAETIEPVLVDGKPTRYIMKESLRKQWSSLENSLLDVADSLMTGHRHSHKFPALRYPRWPHEHGYKHSHSTEESAIASIKRSRQAFVILSSFVTFAMSLWLLEFEDDCFDQAFSMLATRERDPLPRVWLQYLQESIVCDLSPALRPGGFLDPYNSNWGQWIYLFGRASVPIWLIWRREYQMVEPIDSGMAEYFLPPDDVIATAKKRSAIYESVVLPHEYSYSFEPDVNSTIPPTGPPIHFPESSSQSAAPDDDPLPDGVTAENDGDPNLSTQPPIDRTTIVEKYSGQQKKESWQTFFERMERIEEARKKKENATERQSREAKKAHALQHGVSKSATVYIWEQDPKIPTFYRRKHVIKSQVDECWDEFTPHQRLYWSHCNQWDFCPQLPKYPPGATPVLSNHDLEDLEFAEEWLHPTTATELTKPDHEFVGPEMLKTVRAIAGPAEPADDPWAFEFLPLLEYLELRHGFQGKHEDSWNPACHESIDTRLCVDKDEEQTAVKRLLYGTVKITLPVSAFVSIVDFHNTALNTRINYTRLPSSWDISPCSQVSPKLVCDPGYVDVRRAIATSPDGADLWVFRPYRDSPEKPPWLVATTSATTVLLVYRSGWRTMFEIARGLLTLGIPFRTVVDIKKQKDTPSSWRYKPSQGLGRRPKQFKPAEEDFLAYESTRDKLLRSACGRAIRLKGGIVGRIASEIVPDVAVLDGPILRNDVVGYFGDCVFVDDGVDDESLDIVCGVYHVKQTVGGATVRHESFWPKHATWMTTGIAGDQWNPAAEYFYRARLTNFAEKKFDLRSATEWKEKYKYARATTNRVLEGSERLASQFLRLSSSSATTRK
ncbi:hypothetical protein Hypma_005468 [Hypsizygus marmoreus]|uniref:Uncharacterized protein n=1 Tax=Hypsizygus marmoreus TaxID=39966 RepID=A0A369J5S1_HYPMA|nr:hypothetical protein Hypma_005468 [Hypsizygus marmoreus]